MYFLAFCACSNTDEHLTDQRRDATGGSVGSLAGTTSADIPGAGTAGGGTGGVPAAGAAGAEVAGTANCALNEAIDIRVLDAENWNLTTLNNKAGLGTAGAPALLESGCTDSGPSGLANIVCQGTATWSQEADGPVLTFEDGSRVQWNAYPILRSQGAAPPPSPPQPTVWVRFKSKTTMFCPFCGSYRDSSIEIHQEAGGLLLWFSLKATSFQSQEFSRLFGIEAISSLRCSVMTSLDCWDQVASARYDHTLATTPPQSLPYGVANVVGTPNGKFELGWVSRVETGKHFAPQCADGRNPVNAEWFFAQRLSE